MKKIAFLLALLMVIGTIPVWALCGMDGWLDEKSNSDYYPTKAGGLVLNGVHHIVEVPADLLYQPYNDIVSEKKYATGLFTGLGKGILYGVEDAFVGVVDLVSALVPGSHGIKGGYVHDLIEKEAA
ncbi:MAG: hypothetical protein HY351_00495 [Candidatus Omnitrophica bacterium]|nr:hypothetical protein [Candidatus Omnitrophota bacterium]